MFKVKDIEFSPIDAKDYPVVGFNRYVLDIDDDDYDTLDFISSIEEQIKVDYLLKLKQLQIEIAKVAVRKINSYIVDEKLVFDVNDIKEISEPDTIGSLYYT